MYEVITTFTSIEVIKFYAQFIILLSFLSCMNQSWPKHLAEEISKVKTKYGLAVIIGLRKTKD